MKMRHDVLRWFLRSCRADMARKRRWDSRITLLIWRSNQALYQERGFWAFLLRRFVKVLDFWWIRGHIGAYLPPHVVVGPGLRLPHGGMGVVIHHTARIGANVTIYHQVTIGVKDDRPAATLADDAYVGAGAKLLGPILIG